MNPGKLDVFINRYKNRECEIQITNFQDNAHISLKVDVSKAN